MGVHTSPTLKTCKQCGGKKISVSLKSPYLDDSEEECPICEPGSALSRLRSWARANARTEEAELNFSASQGEE